MAGPWEDFQKAAPTASPAADADGPWNDFAPKKKSSLGADIAKSGLSGIASGAAEIAGLPVDFVNAFGKAIGRNPEIQTGSSAQLTGAIAPYLHQPETTAGRVAKYAGSWLPAFLGGPETTVAKLGTRFAAPLAGSTAAGAAFEGTQGEDLARLVGGGGLSGLAMAKARGRANAQAAKSAEAEALEAKPLSPAGQKAHDAWSDVIDESDSKQDVIKGARRFKRTDEYDTLHPDVQQAIDDLAAGNAKRRSETSTLLPLAAGEALGSVVPGAAPLFMVGRAIKDRLANRSALDAAEAIRLGIRRTDVGPVPAAPIARPGPTGPSVPLPRSPWSAPAAPAPGTGFTLKGAPYNPAGYDAAAVARARQAPPAPTPPGVPGAPPGTSLVPYRDPGFTMPGGVAPASVRALLGLPPPVPGGRALVPTRPNFSTQGAPYEPASAEVVPPLTALPPQLKLAFARTRALPAPAPGAPIEMPTSLPIRAGGRPPMPALPAPQATSPSGPIAPATPQLAGPAAPASAPVNLAKSITKARGKVTRVPIETPTPERPAEAPRPGESTAATTAANAGERAPASVSKPAPAPSTLGAEYDGIPDFLRRTAVKPAAPTTAPAAAPEQARPAATYQRPTEAQPALAALTPGFAPKSREQMPFYGRSDHEAVAAEEGAIAAARRAAEGKPGSASDMAKNIARVRSTIAPAVAELAKGASKSDRALLTEMREQMFAAHGSAERLLARDHFLSLLSETKQSEAKAKLTNKLVKAERKHGSTRPYDAATAKQARQEATKTKRTPTPA